VLVFFVLAAVGHVLVPHQSQEMINPLRVCENLPQDVSAFVKEASKKAIAERGQFVVALSGGSLPNMLLSLLQDGTVHFSKWQVLFVDERFVPLDHADSNFLACSPLLARVPRQQIYAIDPTLSLERCAAEYEEVWLAVCWVVAL
jgi:6-phosphogluconolactonase